MKRSAASFDRVMAAFDVMGMARLRRWTVGRAGGRVLEIGAGTGRNLAGYGAVEGVVLLEPDPARLAMALCRGRSVAIPHTAVCAAAERLPFRDGVFDSVVCTLTLCSVQDPAGALSEMHRVTRPGGLLLMLEHVRVPHGGVAHMQDRLAPWWESASGGCRLNRDPLPDALAAGWQVDEVARSAGGWLLRAALHKPGDGSEGIGS